jgi:KUP system potassium uptake protein
MRSRTKQQTLTGLGLAALGVVYGDIGTSPLYTVKTVFDPSIGLACNAVNILSIVSLIVWSLTIVVSLKYVSLILRADNRGEGGIMALLALATSFVSNQPKLRNLLLISGLFGAALFYGDGVITPAISVLSAVEGLSTATSVFTPYVVPITLVILVGVFVLQSRGTADIGFVFGPIMVLWFATLAISGIINILRDPSIFAALNPLYGIRFVLHERWVAFVALGAVVLALTGAEALYADLGHFGAKPIRSAWFVLVFPSLALNYMGQGALLLQNPATLENPFFLMFPQWALYPMVALSTVATVIASQAVITGTYSMTKQAIQLGFLPRMRIVYTSAHEIGQIYIPFVNWLVMAAVLAAVLGFRSSSALGTAYGVAVTGTMLITTFLTFFVVRNGWHMNLGLALAATGLFFLIDTTFFAANLLKIAEGGWFPITIGVAMFVIMSTWKHGRAIMFEHRRADLMPLEPFLASLLENPPTRVPGTAVFLSADPQGVPHALLLNLAHNKILHERVVFLTIVTEEVPWVAPAERMQIHDLGHGCYQITARLGFKDEVALLPLLDLCKPMGMDFELLETSYFVSRDVLIATPGMGMALWREKLFATMMRNAGNMAEFLKLPANRVIELGTQIEI